MKRIFLTAVLGAATLVIAGCGSSADTAAEAPPAAATTTTAAVVTTAAAPATTVSANTATEDAIVAALEGAGVKNAAKWTDEIMEYRPYPADDPSFAKLRGELAKYNPAPDELERIVSVLTP